MNSTSFERDIMEKLNAPNDPFLEKFNPLSSKIRWYAVEMIIQIGGVFERKLCLSSEVFILRPQENDDFAKVDAGTLKKIDLEKRIVKVQLNSFKNTSITISSDYVYDLDSTRKLYVICREWERRGCLQSSID